MFGIKMQKLVSPILFGFITACIGFVIGLNMAPLKEQQAIIKNFHINPVNKQTSHKSKKLFPAEHPGEQGEVQLPISVKETTNHGDDTSGAEKSDSFNEFKTDVEELADEMKRFSAITKNIQLLLCKQGEN